MRPRHRRIDGGLDHIVAHGAVGRIPQGGEGQGGVLLAPGTKGAGEVAAVSASEHQRQDRRSGCQAEQRWMHAGGDHPCRACEPGSSVVGRLDAPQGGLVVQLIGDQLVEAHIGTRPVWIGCMRNELDAGTGALGELVKERCQHGHEVGLGIGSGAPSTLTAMRDSLG